METELEWTSTDVDNWKNFLTTKTGLKLLPKLAETAPALLAGGETNAVLIRAGEMRGLQNALRELSLLANPPPEVKPTPSDYPDLTDDSAWNDGQKIETNSTPAPQ